MNITYKHKITSETKLTPPEIIDLILAIRKIEDINSFLHPPSPLSLTLSDFGFKKKDIHPVMTMLEKIRAEGKTVVIYTDYDADGITGGAILWETLHLLGFSVMPYVPDRKKEGYGFSLQGIDTVKKKYNPALIISVDHGITGIEQIQYARSLGIPVIVTDHHTKKNEVPEDAAAIFHIPSLSGSGVAYFFAKEVYEHFKTPPLVPPRGGSVRGVSSFDILEQNFKTDYLALATIGTVADLVSLVGPSRSVVYHGLKAFPQVRRYGLHYICEEAGISLQSITPYEIGFVIAPRINAVGRLKHAIDALRLLCTTQEARARTLAHTVGELNTRRRDIVKVNVEEAIAQVEAMGELPKLIILHSTTWHEGVIGLIASAMVERYYRPTIVLTRGDGHYKASVRSISGFHITMFLHELSDYFENYGGHAGAAGFTLKKDMLTAFTKEAGEKASAQLTDVDLERTIEADLQIPFTYPTRALAEEIQALAPFGIGNPKPTFVSEGEVVHASVFGKNKEHLKLQVADTYTRSFPLELIAFGKADVFSQLSRKQKLQAVYQLDINRWNGKETLRGMVKELVF